ncbi:MAG TPA: hypothetical protein VLA32_06540 [Anaerolineales bacterium]|jgi:uncharacterized membrane protein (DUF441 family)|nr:hypothetical protein [Anaerolineales bacterium]
MNAPLNLKELERKAFRSFYQDGIWDIFFGLMMFAMYTFTVFNTLENKALRILGMLFLEIFAVFFLIYGKKLITAPRLGEVKFSTQRTKNLGKIILVNLISLIVLAAFAILKTSQPDLFNIENSELYSSVGMGVWIAFITSVMAYFLDFDRLYIYALIYGSTFAAVLLLDLPVLFLAASLLILVPGGILFTRFLMTTKPIQGE